MSLTVCKFYLSNQSCRFGKHCRFFHPEKAPPSSNIVPESEEQHEAVRQASNITQIASLQLTDQEVKLSSQNEALNKNPRKAAHQPVCPHFARGWCRYGKSCRLSHAQPQRAFSKSAKGKPIPPRFYRAEKESSHSIPEDVGSQDTICDNTRVLPDLPDGVQKKQFRKKCAFFKSGQCKKGANCKFVHEKQSISNKVTNPAKEDVSPVPANEAGKKAPEKVLSSQSVTNYAHPKGFNRVTGRPRSHLVFTLAELEAVGRDKVRNDEIEVIKKRFPADKINHKNDGESFVARINFTPSDPDWPFDVKDFTIDFKIPPTYPKETLSVTLPSDQDLPITVRRYVEVSIQEWIIDRQNQLAQNGKVELLFRPFLRWLDRNIEEITTEALLQLKRELTAKAVGFEFIPAKNLQARFKSISESSGNDDKEELATRSENDGESDNSDEDDNERTSDDDGDDDDVKEEETSKVSQSLELQPQQRGTEISLKYLQLKDNASGLLFQRLKVILQCGRCKSHVDVYVSQGSITCTTCHKCNSDMYVTYRPALLHQFSSVLGYLDLDGCEAFDLVFQDCRASVSCMACSKQTIIDGLVTGQVINSWCKACNANLKLATEAIKLTKLAPSGVDTNSGPVIKTATSKAKKPLKDPSIREGYPLPQFGTCKHYKQSFRWLRFPCCGKAYPCDVCHDQQEDHDMTLANRMICGHCCKEQNFSASRPCSGCGGHMTRVRSAHWEGGSGCRDKISMSKGDIQKYKNMNKTVSNKKKMESGSKTKKTKLRHA
ncbi:hypothetical protein EGW08_018481 [Elysia chlorotica]|uniref:Nucleoporin NUP42 n=1 Tax=Elysia chlorotica TaxID=188477 RepID=A0A3S1H7F9_ELYCH|nr:hypothetical protein EGW08_018481 [Elysia chlorotica]